ncbi:hypothetical protein PISMIDRAFT_124275, partial [Pisolithus microcarpus 441]
MASVADKESIARYICNCSKYNFGKPHPVSLATWYRHVDEADTETEKQLLRSTRVRQAAPHLTRTVRRRRDIVQAMAKRRLETVEDARHHIGRRKHGQAPNEVRVFLRFSSASNFEMCCREAPPIHLISPDQGNSPFPFNIEYERRARPIVDVEALAELAVLPSMQHNIQFILALKNASLNDPTSKFTSEALEKIRNPPSHCTLPIDNKGTRYSISAYLALENASQTAYNRVCQAARSIFCG